MKRDELLNSREYWLTKIQFDLFSMIDEYNTEHKVNQTELAKELGFTKGYISQVMHGDHDHRISKVVDLALSLRKAPFVEFKDLDEFIKTDADKIREHNISYLVQQPVPNEFSHLRKVHVNNINNINTSKNIQNDKQQNGVAIS